MPINESFLNNLGITDEPSSQGLINAFNAQSKLKNEKEIIDRLLIALRHGNSRQIKTMNAPAITSSTKPILFVPPAPVTQLEKAIK